MNFQIQNKRNRLFMGTVLTFLLGVPLVAQAGSGFGERDGRNNGDRFDSGGNEWRDNGDSFSSKEFDWADNMGPEDGYGSRSPREFYRGRSDRGFRSDRDVRSGRTERDFNRQRDLDAIIAIYGYDPSARESSRDYDRYSRDYDPYGQDWDTGEARDTEERYYTDMYGDVDTMWEEYDYGGDFDFRSGDDRQAREYPSSERYRSRGHYRDPEAFWDAQPYVSPDTYRYDNDRSREYRRDYRY